MRLVTSIRKAAARAIATKGRQRGILTASVGATGIRTPRVIACGEARRRREATANATTSRCCALARRERLDIDYLSHSDVAGMVGMEIIPRELSECAIR